MGLMPAQNGRIVLGRGERSVFILADGLYDFDLARNSLRHRTPSPIATAALHEPSCDCQRRLWASSINYRVAIDNLTPGSAAFFRRDGDAFTAVRKRIGCSTALLSHLTAMLYHADGPTGTVKAWRLNPENGLLSSGRPFCQILSLERLHQWGNGECSR